MAKTKMTENSQKVLRFLQEAGAGVKFTTKEVVEKLGFEKSGSVTGSLTGLVKKGYAESFTEAVEDENGKVKEVKYFALTDAGMAFDPDAEDED